MTNEQQLILYSSIIVILGITAIIREVLLTKDSKKCDHRAPTQSVKKKGSGWIEGVYHCEPCDFAGHLLTLGAGPCHLCGKKMKKHVAKWSKVKRRWIFK